MLRKIRLLFVVTLVLLFGMLSSSVNATPMEVPGIECPSRPNLFPHILPSCVVMLIERRCERIDSPITETNPGKTITVSGEPLECENCVPGCPKPEHMPSSLTCLEEMSIEYTEEVTATVAAGIEAALGIDFVAVVELRGALEASIGHAAARTITRSATCGASDLPGCTAASYNLELTVTEGIEKKMEHTYVWKEILTSHFVALCTDGLLCPYRPPILEETYPVVRAQGVGQRISTVKGNAYGTAKCRTLTYGHCP